MVAGEASVRLATVSERTGCREWRRQRGCSGDGLDGGFDEGSADLETDSRGRKTVGLVDCAQAVVEVAIGQHALCLCFEPKLG